MEASGVARAMTRRKALPKLTEASSAMKKATRAGAKVLKTRVQIRLKASAAIPVKRMAFFRRLKFRAP